MKRDFGAKQKFIINGIEDLARVAKLVLDSSDFRIIFFYGELGAGKTSLIKELCNQLGVSDIVSSPTYALINEYIGKADDVYHMDLYRLRSEDEVFEIGIEEYLYSGSYCFIEWPQIIESIIDIDYHIVRIKELDDGSRELIFE